MRREKSLMHSALAELCPPLIRRSYRRIATRCPWSGDFASWEAAASQCSGYDGPAILEAVLNAARRVKMGHGSFERDSVVFDEPDDSWPLLTLLFRTAAAHAGRLHVLDFGGSLGSVYFQYRSWLSALPEVRWDVVEQPAYVEQGRVHYEGGPLAFHATMAGALEKGRPNLVLLSSVLGYLADPWAILAEIAEADTGDLVIDRTGFTRNDRDRITIQRVPPEIYPASYPCRFFSRSALVRRLSGPYELAADFPALDEATPFADFVGLYFLRTKRSQV